MSWMASRRVATRRMATSGTRRSRVVSGALLALLGLTVSGCGFSGLYNIPLPGGANLGAHPYTITADFTDALDLVPQSAVKVNDVPVGRVESISLTDGGQLAAVKMQINNSVVLPANAVAAVDQTSLLGEKYVSLAGPTSVPAEGRLASGAVIGVSQTTEGIQVEQVLGALSLLLNGGGVAQLQTIDKELNAAQNGHEADFRGLLTSLDSVVGQLNTHRSDITSALDALAQLSATLQTNDAKISTALAGLPPGLAVLAEETPQLNATLQALNRLSAVSVSTISASQTDFVSDLNLLDPILSQLAAAGSALPASLQVLFTYPFPDGALAAIKGDYINTFITLDLHSTESQLDATLQPGLSQSQVSPSKAATKQAKGTILADGGAPPTLLPATSSALGIGPGTATGGD